MVSHDILLSTAALYKARARDDDRYNFPRDVLDHALNELGLEVEAGVAPLANSPQFIVLRTSGTTGEPKLLRHAMDFHESVVDSGVEALSRRGLLGAPHICLIAISRGRLSGGFLFIYEVARRCGWSILLLGASDDPDDVADLCAAYSVDVVFMAPNTIGAIFSPRMRGRFDTVRELLYIGEVPSPSLIERMVHDYPHVRVSSFIYSTNDTGPLGIPIAEGSDTSYEVPPNVLLEVEAEGERGDVALNGSGQLLVSVLGLEDPKLIRWRVGDVGALRTDAAGHQTLDLLGRGDVSVKFHLDSVGGSVILNKSVAFDFLTEHGVRSDLDVIMQIKNDASRRTSIVVNLVLDEPLDLETLEEQLNLAFPVRSLRGRFVVSRITDEEARTISPGKRRFFVKSY